MRPRPAGQEFTAHVVERRPEPEGVFIERVVLHEGNRKRDDIEVGWVPKLVAYGDQVDVTGQRDIFVIGVTLVTADRPPIALDWAPMVVQAGSTLRINVNKPVVLSA